jgi:hypothetical protein
MHARTPRPSYDEPAWIRDGPACVQDETVIMKRYALTLLRMSWQKGITLHMAIMSLIGNGFWNQACLCNGADDADGAVGAPKWTRNGTKIDPKCTRLKLCQDAIDHGFFEAKQSFRQKFWRKIFFVILVRFSRRYGKVSGKNHILHKILL